MLEIKPIDNLEQIHGLKQAYFDQSTAPLDGMWHFGFVPMATHYGFYERDNLVGYCCINAEGYILQFYLSNEANTDQRELFATITDGNSSVIGNVKGAFVSTAEPQYLSLCMDNSSQFTVNALMYQHMEASDENVQSDVELHQAPIEKLELFVEFAAMNIGAPKDWY